MSESERLREALIDLERARDRERELRLESEALLTGLRVLTTTQSKEVMFSELLEVFRPILSFQDAFVLTARDDKTMRPVSSSSMAFADSVWQPKALFKRVIEGMPTAVFDVEQVEEWKDQPEHVRAAVKSALHIPLSSGKQATVLICTHPEHGHFGQRHVRLMRRFVPLASQALLDVDLHTADLERRSTQLQTAAEVSRAASSILAPDELIQRVVDLICERFGLYYAGLFLVDQTGIWTGEPGRWAVLRAGTGEAGQKMLEQGHKLEIGGTSMIGWSVANKQARIALDVGEEAVRFDNPFLPETRFELALPLVSRGEIIGAMTIQSTQVAAFSEEDITVFQTMADQLANAIENARLIERAQTALAEMEATHRRYLQKAWEDYASTPEANWGYLRSEDEERPTAEAWLPAMTAALQQIDTVVERNKQDDATLAIPLTVSGEVIGVLGGCSSKAEGWSEDEIAAAEAIIEQMALALENQRLFDEEQRASSLLAERVKDLDCLNDIGRKMEETPPIPEFLQWVTERIPPAMHYSDVCVAAIEFEGQVYGVAEAVSLPCQMVHALRIGGEVVGRICIAYTEDHDFLDEESALLGDIIRRVSGYIESRHLFEQTRAALTETEALYRASAELNAAQTYDDILTVLYKHTLLDQADRNITIDVFNRPWTAEQMPEWVDVLARRTPLPPETTSVRYALQDFPSVPDLLRPDAPTVITDIENDPRLDENVRVLFSQQFQARCVIFVPLVVGGEWIGYINGIYSEPIEFLEAELRLLMSLSSQAAVTVQNMRLFEQAQDRAGRERLTREITDKMRRAVDIDDLVRTTVQELAQALGTSHTVVELGTDSPDPSRVSEHIQGQTGLLAVNTRRRES